MIGLESCFGAVNKILIHENEMKIENLIDLLTIKPRRIMGFDENLFEEGTAAELTIINPKEKWIFSKNDIYSRSINSPFIDQELKGKVKFTISKGMIAEV